MDEEKDGTSAPASTPEEQSPDPDPLVDPGHDQPPAPPRRLDPPRPWLRSEANGRSSEPVAPLAGDDDGSTRLQPIRPWLKQRRSEQPLRSEPFVPTPGAATPDVRSPTADHSRTLDPPRPWLERPQGQAASSPRPVPSNAEQVLKPLAAEVEASQPHADREQPRHAALPGQPAWPISFDSPETAPETAAEGARPAAAIAGADEPPDLPPDGRLRRLSRWLFEQAPAHVEDPTHVGAPATEHPGARDEAPDEAPAISPSPRSDLSRRLAAPPPEPSAVAAVVPIPPGTPMRPTIAWDELTAPTQAPAEVAEPAVEQAPEPVVEDEAVEPEPQPAVEPEPEPAVEQASEPEPVLPRPRPRPYAGAPVRTDDPEPHRGTPSIASGVAPFSLVRATAPAKDDFFTRTDDEDGAPDQAAKSANGRTKGGRRGVRWLVRTGVILAIAVLAAVLLRVYVVAPYYIPSASMEPTLHGCPGCNNDHVLVDKLSYRMHDIHRGDVVVFHRPATWQVSENTLIKRVVGLPGDRLRVADGKLFVNGLLLQEPYTNPKCPPMHTLAESPARPSRTFGPIPRDEVYVMGDNRCDSTDSRAFGPVPESKIVGRAFVIFWPLGRVHFL